MPETKRQKLTITEVHEAKSFGTKGGQKVEFLCDGKKWVAYKKSLFAHIVVGAEIDADTETKERSTENGTFTDRIVTQIYIEGKPVFEAKPYQYQAKGYSPEERASIESQQAAKFTTELWIAGKLDAGTVEVARLRAWLLARLNPEAPKAAQPKHQAKAANESEPKFVDQAKEVVKAANNLKRDPMTVKNYAELCKACWADFDGMQPKEVLNELNVNTQSEITDTMPDCYIKIATVRQGPKEQE